MNERGVSDVVGYVLVFSLIVATVGVVTVTGFGTLEDRRTAEQINNAERALDVFANNVENLYRDGAPSRATEMRLSGGTLRYGEPVNITVADATDPAINNTVQMTPLVYSEGEAEIIYVGGAVLRSDRGSTVMLRNPPFRIGSERSLIPLIQTTDFPGVTSVSVDGTVRITATAVGRTAVPEPALSEAEEIRLNVSSPRDEVWEGYFDQLQADIGGNVTNGEEVSYTFKTEELSAPQYRIQLRLHR